MIETVAEARWSFYIQEYSVLRALFMFQVDIRHIFYLIQRLRFVRSKGSDVAHIICVVSELY